jgi:hypothetical protein
MNNEPLEREPMNNEPLEREPIDRVRARLEALLKANAAPRCGARSKRTGKPCLGAAMPNGRCKFHGGKSTGPRPALLALRDLCDSIYIWRSVSAP